MSCGSQRQVSQVGTAGVAGVGDSFMLTWEETVPITAPQGTAAWQALTFLYLEPKVETPWPEHIPPLPSSGP